MPTTAAEGVRVALSQSARVGIAGASVVGVAFGMARYAYGLTLPAVRADLGLSEAVLGLIASATFVGYLVGLLAAGPLAARSGPRAPTTVGGACGALGCAVVATAQPTWLLAVGAVVAGSAAGWVWAPYSDIVMTTVPAEQRPRALALITTGTSGGLVLLGALAVLSVAGHWRPVWACVALAAALAAVLNRRLVPRTAPERRPPAPGAAVPHLPALRVPLGYAVVYFAAVVVYFTYAADVLSRGAAPAWAVPALYAAIGAGGVVALATGSLVQRLGSHAVAALSLVAVAAALALLAAVSSSPAATSASALVFGVGYMTGSAVLAVWTAQVVPDRAGAAFTACLVVGALSSIATPTLAGAVITALGPEPVLLVAAGASCAAAAALLLPGLRRR